MSADTTTSDAPNRLQKPNVHLTPPAGQRQTEDQFQTANKDYNRQLAIIIIKDETTVQRIETAVPVTRRYFVRHCI
jgi:hypothetical protein